MQSIAFAPGHISGFFQPCYDKDPLKTGSRGAGLSLSFGARTQVTLEPAMNQSNMYKCQPMRYTETY